MQDKNQNIKDPPSATAVKVWKEEKKKKKSRIETALRIQIHKHNFGFSI